MVTRKPFRAILGAGLVSLLLWGYAAILLFIWYFARMLPDSLVLIRVGASILADLIWLPFGIAVWNAAAFLLLRTRAKSAVSAAIIGILTLVILFNHHAAFKWMFVPLAADSVILLYGLRRRSIGKATGIPLVLTVLIVIAYYGGQLLPSIAGDGGSGMTLKVMSYNVYGRAETSHRSLQIDTILREDPDIVCIIEYYPRTDYRLFMERLGDRYPYHVSNRRETSWNSGELVLSRYPITSRRLVAIPGPTHDMDFMFSEVEVNGRTINLVSFHLITVGHEIIDQVFSTRSYAERIEVADRSEREKDRIKFDQARELVEFAEKLEDPLILCGDMNDTPNSRTYRLFSRNFTNTFNAAGWGLGDTFGELSLARKLTPHVARDVIRIDHIFVDEAFRVLSAEVIEDAEGSDHKPVVATLSLDLPQSE